MKQAIVLFFAVLTLGRTTAQPPHPFSGRIQRIDSFPSQYVTPRTLDVWLPEGYDGHDGRYDVLYMHDGQMLFDSSRTWNHQEWHVDETIGVLLKRKEIRPVIVVGIANDGTNRHAEYTPQRPAESLPKPMYDSLLGLSRRGDGRSVFSGRIRSDAYLRFLVKEVKPYIDRAFRTRTGPAHTFLAGSSMGGLISLYALCEYPQVFGGAACLSTHWPILFSEGANPLSDSLFSYLERKLPAPGRHRIYFDLGDQTLDARYPSFQDRMDELMRRKGYSASDWTTRRFPGAEHTEKAWSDRLSIPLLFLLAAPR